MQKTVSNRIVDSALDGMLKGAIRELKRSPQIPSVKSLPLDKSYRGPAVFTPEDATRILATINVGNRRKRVMLVDYLVREIKAGEWQPDHPQPVVFSDTGRLIDGQHRMEAIVASGETLVCNVVCGARDELRAYIDNGISRQLEDRISLSDDLQQNKRLVQLINAMFWIDGAAHVSRPTPQDAIEIFTVNRASLLFVEGYMAKSQRRVTIVASMLALKGMHDRNPEKAREFADALTNPDSPLQQARRLREYLIGAPGGGACQVKERYHKSIGAMLAYLEDRPVTVLRSATWPK